MIDWRIEGVSFGNCSCDSNCPCQFELDPTHSYCRGIELVRIDRGHFSDVQLSGLSFVMTYAWPGPIYEGNGEMQAIIDDRADERQRAALLTILYGGETEEAKTHWWVFRAMSSKVHDPMFAPIEIEIDIDRRRGRASVPGLLESTGRPLASPVTGNEHRIRINLPDGIEFEVAEIGAASTSANGAVSLALRDSYGQFNFIRHTGSGIIRGGGTSNVAGGA